MWYPALSPFFGLNVSFPPFPWKQCFIFHSRQTCAWNTVDKLLGKGAETEFPDSGVPTSLGILRELGRRVWLEPCGVWGVNTSQAAPEVGMLSRPHPSWSTAMSTPLTLAALALPSRASSAQCSGCGLISPKVISGSSLIIT